LCIQMLITCHQRFTIQLQNMVVSCTSKRHNIKLSPTPASLMLFINQQDKHYCQTNKWHTNVLIE
jgi:hypothetical protein